jgi:hypothetical protein
MLFNVSAQLIWKDPKMAASRAWVRSTVQSHIYVEARHQKAAARKWVSLLTSDEQDAIDLIVVYRTPNKVDGGYRGSDFEYRPKDDWETRPSDAYNEIADLDRMGGRWKES